MTLHNYVPNYKINNYNPRVKIKTEKHVSDAHKIFVLN